MEKGSVCETFIGDMGNYSDVQKMFDMCLQRFGQVDVLINNAGISVVGLFQDMAEMPLVCTVYDAVCIVLLKT